MYHFNSIPIENRFSESYEVDENTNCWNWKKSFSYNQFPLITITTKRKIKRIRAHRYAYEKYIGEIPKKTSIERICENFKCVNPTHLQLKFKAGMNRISLKDNFERSYIINKNTGCWEWQKNRDKKGYGTIGSHIGDKRITKFAHRVSYELYKGEIPINMIVCHACDNPGCVNPDHLWIGTHQDNINDKIKKNRGLFGSKHQNSKLTEEQIIKIRKEKLSINDIAKKYRIHYNTAYDIINFKSWSHVK